MKPNFMCVPPFGRIEPRGSSSDRARCGLFYRRGELSASRKGALVSG
jgi:hypothetical protein